MVDISLGFERANRGGGGEAVAGGGLPLDINALVEAVTRGDGFRSVGYGIEGCVAGVVGGEEPVGDAGEGFLLAERWADTCSKDERKGWRKHREGGIGVGRRGGNGCGEGSRCFTERFMADGNVNGRGLWAGV